MLGTIFILQHPAPSHATATPMCNWYTNKGSWVKVSKCFYKICRSLYQVQSFVAARRCFREQGKTLRSKPTFSTKKYYLGLFVWGHIQSLRKLASQTTGIKAAWLREQALHRLSAYRKQKLYTTDEKKLASLRLEQQLIQKIGYAQLSVKTSHNRTVSCIEGLRFRRCIDGNKWSIRLRPGFYKLVLRYPGSPPVFRNTKLLLASNGRKSLVFVPPNTSQKASLTIRSHPPGVLVFIDTVLQGKTPLTRSVYVGVRQIELKKHCHQLLSRAVAVRAKRTNTFTATLIREPIFIEWQKRRKNLSQQQLLGWSLFGGGALIAIIGGVSHLLANGSHDASKGILIPSQYQEHVNEGNTYRTIGHVGVGIGLGMSSIGAIWLATRSIPAQSSLPCKVKTKARSK